MRAQGVERYSPAVAKETRKLQRAGKQTSGKARRAQLNQPMMARPGEMPDPLGPAQLKSLAWRLGLPILGVWLIGSLIFAVSYSTTAQVLALGLPALITVGALGLVGWAFRQAKKARGVANILRNVETAEDRKQALSELETSFKKKDVAAIFAKAQLELQEDPDKALATLEQIDLDKVMGAVADEARAQRAMIHLMKGQVSLARQLADNIDLKRHQEAKSRAMMAAVVAEAWARSGQSKKGLETLEVFNPEDDLYVDLKPQLYRAYAYAYAHANNVKGMRRVLRKLLEQDVRLLGSFMMKKTHPLLQKEARKLVEQSGMVPRRMQVQRSLKGR